MLGCFVFANVDDELFNYMWHVNNNSIEYNSNNCEGKKTTNNCLNILPEDTRAMLYEEVKNNVLCIIFINIFTNSAI